MQLIYKIEHLNSYFAMIYWNSPYVTSSFVWLKYFYQIRRSCLGKIQPGRWKFTTDDKNVLVHMRDTSITCGQDFFWFCLWFQEQPVSVYTISFCLFTISPCIFRIVLRVINLPDHNYCINNNIANCAYTWIK